MDNSMFNCEAMKSICNDQVDPQHIADMIKFPKEFQPFILPTITLMSAVFNEILSRRFSKPMEQEVQEVPKPNEVTNSSIQEVAQPKKVFKSVEQEVPKEHVNSRRLTDPEELNSTAGPPKPPPLPAGFLDQLKSTITAGPILANKSQVPVSNSDILIPESDNNAPADSASTSPLTNDAKGSRPSFAIGDIQAGLTRLKKTSRPVPVKPVAVEPSLPLKNSLRPISQRQPKSSDAKTGTEGDSPAVVITLKPFAPTKLDDISDKIENDINPSTSEARDCSLFGNRVKRKNSLHVNINKDYLEGSQNIDPKLLERLNRQKKIAEGKVLENSLSENVSSQSSSDILESKLVNLDNNKPNILSETVIPILQNVDNTTTSEIGEPLLVSRVSPQNSEKRSPLKPIQSKQEVKNQATEDHSLRNCVDGQIFGDRVKRRESLQFEQSKPEEVKNITDPKLLQRLNQQKEKAEEVILQTSNGTFTEQKLQTVLDDSLHKIKPLADKNPKPIISSKPSRPKTENVDSNKIPIPLPWYPVEVKANIENSLQISSIITKSHQNHNSDFVLPKYNPIKPPPVPKKPFVGEKPNPTVTISTKLETIATSLIDYNKHIYAINYDHLQSSCGNRKL